MRRTGYNPTHRSGDLDLLRERLRSRDRCRLRSLPGDPFLSRSLERERLRLRDSRSFPAVSRSFLSDESPAIWNKRGRKKLGLLTRFVDVLRQGCVSVRLIGLRHMHLLFKNLFVKLYNIYLSRLNILLYRLNVTEQEKHIVLFRKNYDFSKNATIKTRLNSAAYKHIVTRKLHDVQ